MIKSASQIIALLRRCRKLRRFYLELTNENFYLADLIKELREALTHELNELKLRIPAGDPARARIDEIQTSYQKHPEKKSALQIQLRDICHHLDREVHDLALHQQNLQSFAKALTHDIETLEKFTAELDLPEPSAELAAIDIPVLIESIQKKLDVRERNLNLEVHVAHQCLHEMRMRFSTYFQGAYRLNAHLSDEALILEDQPMPAPALLVAAYQEFIDEEQALGLRINQLQEHVKEVIKEHHHLDVEAHSMELQHIHNAQLKKDDGG